MFLSSQIYIFSHLYPVIMKVLSTYQFPEIIPEWMAATIFQDHSCMYYYIQSQTKIKISDLLSLFILEQFRPIYICSQNFFSISAYLINVQWVQTTVLLKKEISYTLDFFDIRPCFGDARHQEPNINRYHIYFICSFLKNLKY